MYLADILLVSVILATAGLSEPAKTASKDIHDHGVKLPTVRPLNLGHRGSSGALPENTAEAVAQAIEDGADAVEFDLCLTKDLRLVSLHESWIGSTTNIADIFPEERMNTYFVQDQGRQITDYFTVDFTLEELKQVRVNQRQSYRDHNYDGQFEIATLEEVIEVIQGTGGGLVAPYPEVKDPIWVNSLDIIAEAETTFEDLLLDILTSYGYIHARDPIFIQSFNEDSIRYISTKSNLSLSLLKATSYSDEVLEELSHWCYGIGPNKRLIVQTNLQDQITGRTDLVDRAHSFGLKVHPYTFRNEDRHLAWDYEQDPYMEYKDFLELGVDGLFTDFPATFSRLLNATYN